MELKQTLISIQQQMATQVPAEILSAFAESLNQLIQEKIEHKALKIGDIAPNISLMLSNQRVELVELLKKGPVVLNFFRGNWCPFCLAELKDYQAKFLETTLPLEQFFFISPQKDSYNQLLKNDNDLCLKIVSDEHNKIAHQFGLVFQLQKNIQKIYKEIGADLSIFNEDDSFELPIPATYIIDSFGKISYAFVEPNYMLRAEPNDIFQHFSLLNKQDRNK